MVQIDGSISIPPSNCIRLVSFNINGYKTLNHYHPWNQFDNLSKSLDFFNADIISFQELKLQQSDINKNLANLPNYKSFISIPISKKGYSGVSLFIKNSNNYKILKVENGITGFLTIKGSKNTYRKEWLYKENDESCCSIGGYTDNIIDWKIGQSIDSNGRCIIVELSINLIIIVTYCPANSSNNEIEEISRCLFIETLFQRVKNLEKMGKNVIIMGDINISPSLIDRDDEIAIGIKNNLLITNKINDKSFEFINASEVLDFRNNKLSRTILWKYLYDYENLQSNENKFLFDLGRYKNINKMKKYTCWNTLLNNRPLNIGSRIDLFLSTKKIEELCVNCDIWNFLYGSDHCPVYCDIDISSLNSSSSSSSSSLTPNFKHFEAMNYYDLASFKSIASFFKSKQSSSASTPSPSPESNIVSSLSAPVKRSQTTPAYESRKKPKNQATLFSVLQKKTASNNAKINESSLFVTEDSDDEDNDNNNDDVQKLSYSQPDTTKLTNFNTMLRSSSTIPTCSHDEPCVLRTTKKGANMGRKFWCCAKPSKDRIWDDNDGNNNENKLTDKDCNCNYFKWAQK